jgi:urease accessory protein
LKFSIQTDFTKFQRATSVLRAGEGGAGPAADSVALAHDERHLRRRALPLASGEQILVDLLEPVALASGDRLVLEDGRQVGIVAADEDVLEVRARDAVHLAELAWHIGARQLAAAISADRILILRDDAIKDALEKLGATVNETTTPFEPLRDHSGHHHDHHGHGHGEHGHGDHGHGERDKYGRLPGDPHYGHNHA